MKKQYEVLQWAFSFLKKHGCEENIANVLLQHHLNKTQEQLMFTMREEVSEKLIIRFMQDIKRHVQTGIPIQHIVGYAYFYGRKFFVNGNVLIPRFDTETLVQQAITATHSQFNEKENITIVDVGTGSGIIAITLALELPNANVYATDISDYALEVAKKNAILHGANIQFFSGNFLEPMIQREINPDVIVSNPPYIKDSDRDMLAKTVKDYDPPTALYGGEDGMSAYVDIISQIQSLKKIEKRIICFEIGFDQAKDVTKLMKKNLPNSIISVQQDLHGKDRVVTVKKFN